MIVRTSNLFDLGIEQLIKFLEIGGDIGLINEVKNKLNEDGFLFYDDFIKMLGSPIVIPNPDYKVDDELIDFNIQILD